VFAGTPMSIGVIFDEALPYFKGKFDQIFEWKADPPEAHQTPSTSFYPQRFYMSEVEGEGAVCRSMQIKVEWGEDNAQNELLTMTVYGAFMQEN